MTTGPELAVGAIVVDEGRLLMVRRGGDPGRGLWSLPGGRIERGEYMADALKREVLEETGVGIEPGELVGIFEITGEDYHYVVLDFYASAEGPSEPQAAGDAVEARWVPLPEVKDLECTPRFVETMRGWGVLE